MEIERPDDAVHRPRRRDGAGGRCVGCNADPRAELASVKAAAHLPPPSRKWLPAKFANQLRDLVRNRTEPYEVQE